MDGAIGLSQSLLPLVWNNIFLVLHYKHIVVSNIILVHSKIISHGTWMSRSMQCDFLHMYAQPRSLLCTSDGFHAGILKCVPAMIGHARGHWAVPKAAAPGMKQHISGVTTLSMSVHLSSSCCIQNPCAMALELLKLSNAFSPNICVTSIATLPFRT